MIRRTAGMFGAVMCAMLLAAPATAAGTKKTSTNTGHKSSHSSSSKKSTTHKKSGTHKKGRGKSSAHHAPSTKPK